MRILWLPLHFNFASGVIGCAVALYLICLAPFLGRRRYKRLLGSRERDPDALVAFYQRTLVRQWVLGSLTLLLLALAPRARAGNLGLEWPKGPYAAFWTWYGALIGAAIIATSFAWRRRALQGKKIPGQRVFAGIIPRTKREKRVAAVVAFSAGTTEELFYRGLIMSIAGDLLGLSPYLAALVASICFGVAHIYQGWRGVLPAALLGGLLNLLLLWTGSLLVPALLHVSLDFRGLVIVPLRAEARGPRRGQASLVHPAERR